MLTPFCGDTQAVLLAQIKSWVDASTRSEFHKIVVAAARKSGREPCERLTRLQAFVSDTVGEALLERALASRVAGADACESCCLRWKRPRGRAAQVGLPDVGEAR